MYLFSYSYLNRFKKSCLLYINIFRKYHNSTLLMLDFNRYKLLCKSSSQFFPDTSNFT